MGKKHLPRRSGLLVAICLFVAAVAAGAATAGPPKSGTVTGLCDWMDATLPTPFAPWDDFGQYFLLSGGDFEGDLSGWTLSDGAAVVARNESYQIGSPTDDQSLLLPPGSSVTTPNVCVTALSPDLRVALMSTGAKDPGSRSTSTSPTTRATRARRSSRTSEAGRSGTSLIRSSSLGP
jgi:hypothetical protein